MATAWPWVAAIVLAGSSGAPADVIARYDAANFNDASNAWTDSVGSWSGSQNYGDATYNANLDGHAAVVFNGSSSLKTPTGLLNGATALSLTATFNTTASVSGNGADTYWWGIDAIFSSEHGGWGQEFAIGLGTNGQTLPQAGVGDSTDPKDTYAVYGSEAANDGDWHAMTFTWSNSGTGTLYVDGSQVDSRNDLSTETRNTVGYATGIGGVATDTGPAYFNGAVGTIIVSNNVEDPTNSASDHYHLGLLPELGGSSVPEPSTVALFALGLGALVTRRRRRK